MTIPPIHLDCPERWQITSEARLVEPPRPGLGVPLAGKGESLRPGATISIARGVTGAKSADEALDTFLRYFAEEATGLKQHARGPVRFSDGTLGASMTLSFEPAPGTRVSQRHLYRLDGDVITHLTITVGEREAARLDADLFAVADTFRP